MPKKETQSKTTKNEEKTGKDSKTKEVKEKSKTTTKTTTTKAPKTSKKEPKVVEPELSDVEDESKTKKLRTVPTKESVVTQFDELVSFVDEEIEKLRESQQKSKGVKTLRSLGKKIKNLRTNVVRVMKQKQKTNRKNNSNSGFLKPVRISKEMSSFTGWSQSELKSRVDITKFICDYIKQNNLQNPEDRRQIMPDKKLTKLLDCADGEQPLTYYRIQTYMKKHFSNPDTVEVGVAATAGAPGVSSRR